MTSSVAVAEIVVRRVGCRPVAQSSHRTRANKAVAAVETAVLISDDKRS